MLSLLVRSRQRALLILSEVLLLASFINLADSVLASPPTSCQLSNPKVSDRNARVLYINQLHDQIQNLVGTPFALNLSQCRTIAIGNKPCGGPGGYLVYSALLTPDETKLKQLVSEFTTLQHQLHTESGVMSDCRFVTPPEVDLVNNICTARSPIWIPPSPQTTPPLPNDGEEQE
jgi:hypothetical protein